MFKLLATPKMASVNYSQGVQRMLYDSFDDEESMIQPPISTLKRSLSYVDTTQPLLPSSTTTWLQQSSSSAAQSEHGIIIIHCYCLLLLINLYTI